MWKFKVFLKEYAEILQKSGGFLWKLKNFCEKLKGFLWKLKSFCEKLKDFCEKLKKFQKTWNFGKYIYSICLKYAEKKPDLIITPFESINLQNYE